MEHLHELIAECIASPDDDGPRLVWADAIGGERGEFVVLQCDLARGGVTAWPPGGFSPEESGARRRRQRELLAQHGAEWAGLAGLATRCTFRRGFVESAEIDVPTFLDKADEIFAAAPLLRSFKTIGVASYENERGERSGPDTVAVLTQLFAHPGYQRITGLELATEGTWVKNRSEAPDWFDVDPLVLALSSGAFDRLRAFATDYVGDVDARALVDSGHLARLDRLWVRYQSSIELMSRVNARELDLIRPVTAQLTGSVPITELILTHVSDAGLAAVAEHPVAATVERLSLAGRIIEAPHLLAAFPRLRSLDVSKLQWGARHDGPDVSHPMAATPLPALRELCLGVHADEDLSIANAFGEQLELLDIQTGFPSPERARKLRPLIAGDLRMRAYAPREKLLFVGDYPLEPWWDHEIIEPPKVR